MTGRSVSAVTAYTAHREWASRPPDERYASVHALYEAARARRGLGLAARRELIDERLLPAAAEVRHHVLAQVLVIDAVGVRDLVLSNKSRERSVLI